MLCLKEALMPLIVYPGWAECDGGRVEGRMERPAKACGKKDGMMARFGHGASVGRFIINTVAFAPLLYVCASADDDAHNRSL